MININAELSVMSTLYLTMGLPSIKLVFYRTLKYVLMGIGTLFLFMILLSFTSIPYDLRLNLGLTEEAFEGAPEVIVMLGGDGMPSGDGILRCYYTALAADEYSNAMVVVAFPAMHPDSSEHLERLKRELNLRGVNEHRIEMEWKAVNTHEQGVNLASKYAGKRTLLVTAPAHTSRAIAVFKHEGFSKLEGLATFETDVGNDELHIQDTHLLAVNQTSLRYNMWSYLKYEIEIAREYTATLYYWLRGWL